MSALQNAQLMGSGAADLTPVQRVALAAVFWEWYRKHSEDVIVKRKVIVFTVTIRVHDLRPLFEALFGPE
jgi:hypothetical protein